MVSGAFPRAKNWQVTTYYVPAKLTASSQHMLFGLSCFLMFYQDPTVCPDPVIH